MKLVIDIPDKDYEFIKDLQSLIIGGRGNCKTIQYNVINAIKNGTPYEERPKGEWIPVTERLPNNHEYIKNNGLFNVSDGNRSYSEWFDICETEMFGEPTISGFRVDRAVIAWMPMPEPYRGDV